MRKLFSKVAVAAFAIALSFTNPLTASAGNNTTLSAQNDKTITIGSVDAAKSTYKITVADGVTILEEDWDNGWRYQANYYRNGRIIYWIYNPNTGKWTHGKTSA